MSTDSKENNSVSESAAGRSEISLYAAGLSLTFVIGVIDYLTGSEIGISVFYLAPIAYVSWKSKIKFTGYMFSVLAAGTIFLADFLAGKVIAGHFIEFWNILVHSLFFATVVMLLTRLRSSLLERDSLIGELRVSLKEIRTLSGLLPICASCKKIRDNIGVWQKLEDYISGHSDAKFTHGICPDCAKKLYPGFTGA